MKPSEILWSVALFLLKAVRIEKVNKQTDRIFNWSDTAQPTRAEMWKIKHDFWWRSFMFIYFCVVFKIEKMDTCFFPNENQDVVQSFEVSWDVISGADDVNELGI